MFFAVLTLVGLLTAGGYGLPLDGFSEQVILQENLKEYAVLLLGEESDAVQGYDALGIDRITESIEMDHGQAAYYPAAPLLKIRDTNPSLFNTLWHMYTWLWFMVAVLSVYTLGRSLGLSRTLACATALLLYLSPRFFAEGHYNNKDIVLMALSLWTIAAGARFLQKPDVRRGLWFALAGALAANIRIIGFFVFGVMGIMIVVSLLARRALNEQALFAGGTAFGAFVPVYMLVTPAFFMNPGGFITHVLHNATAFSRWTGVVIFKGAVYDPTGGLPLPHSYLPTMIALTVPVCTLMLIAVGCVYALWRIVRGDTRRPVLIALFLLIAVPAAYAVLAQPLMYNGWRHFYFLYGPMVALAGLGLEYLYGLLCKNRIAKTAGIAALALVFLYQGVGLALNHPFQYAYYNVLTADAEQDFELDYWELSTYNAMQLLAENGERNPDLPLTLGGGDPMSLFSLNQSVQMLPNDLSEAMTITEEDSAPYVFSNTTYAAIYSQKPGENYRELFTIESYGNVLCTVFERLR